LVTGHVIGGTDYSAEFSAPLGVYYCYDSNVCADQAFGGGGTANVAPPPVIGNVSPTTFTVGTSGPIVISGSNFAGLVSCPRYNWQNECV
jgi:hypothetical protein